MALGACAAILFAQGCGKKKDAILNPQVGPTAGFNAIPRSGINPLDVDFQDLSASGSSAITSWLWSFGDGTASTARNPSHLYASPGRYTVSLAVTTAVGSNTMSQADYVVVSDTNVIPPTARFSGTPRGGPAPLVVQFTDESTPGSSPLESRTWSFGDGATSTAQSPSHTYTAPGSYAVSLIVRSSSGSDTLTQAGYIDVFVKPVAQFSGSPTSGQTPLTVQFTDQSTAGSAPITSWQWTFGDGGTSAARSPSHTYTNPGSYTVSLTVTTSAGQDTQTKTSYISASSPIFPTALFSGSSTSGPAPLTVQFTDQSTSGSSPITSWSWSFGDGGTSTAQSPGHTYTAAGSYTVSLTVASASGSDTETKSGYITVFVLPAADFSGSPRSGPSPLVVQFTDQSTPGSSPITSWQWSFGDGSTSTAQNPSYMYTAAGTYTVSLKITTSAGTNTRTKTSYVAVASPVPPTAQFSGSPTSGGAPLMVQFTDQSTPGGSPITSWFWSFGDGSTSTAQNPSYLYTISGSYTVSLTVQSASGSNTQTRTSYITVSRPAPPTAQFSGTPTSGQAPLAVQFTDQSTAGSAPITSWSWTFGDGGTSTAQSPSHTYTAAGSYTVRLIVGSSAGVDTLSRAGYIGVFVNPTAEFSGTPTSGLAPLVVQFTDQSAPGSSPITSWSWTFGDGGTSTARSPVHTYTAAGSYNVSLTVTTAVGQDAQTKTGYINASSAIFPTALFSGTPTSGRAPLGVQFTDESTAGSAPITSWSWTFGDGATSTAQSPSHTYTGAGSYTVRLIVASSAGIDTLNRVGYVTAFVLPTASFSGAPQSGRVPLAVQFTDQSTAGSAPITSRSWTFGDGGTSTSQNPSHTYTGAGSYTVRLIVGSSAGRDTLSRASYIGVFLAPTASFSGSPRSGASPLAVQFTDQSTAGSTPITSWSWTFGDGVTSTAQNPSHTYTAAGSYAVRLIVGSSAGSDTLSRASYIGVFVNPTAEFSGTPTSGLTPLIVQFTDQSAPGSSPITSWSWTFGDGGTSTAQNPTHTYTPAGSYDVSLTVTTAAGQDTQTKTSYITASSPIFPTAQFSGTPTSGQAPLAVQFTDQSTAGSAPITSWGWTFGDGGTSTAQNPSHTYTAAGSYTVRLIVGSSAGRDTLSRASYIAVSSPVAPTAQFSGTPTSGQAPLAVQFTDQSTAGTSAITSWNWTFGDGGTSTTQNPSHTYTGAGSFTVRLIVGSSAGIDTLSRAGYIGVFVNPTAEFSGTPTSGQAPLAVQFTDQSTPGSAPITSWSWTFGDGGTSTAQNPSHTYTVAGSYTVRLIVASSAGRDTLSRASYIAVSSQVAPTAQFSGTPTSGPAPLAVQFTDESTAGTSAITSWSWTFGDGGTSTTQNPSHTYTGAGSYTVRLIVGSSAGVDTLSRASYVGVFVNPTADFSGTPTNGLAPLVVQFTDQSAAGSSPITSWSWTFGDGGTSTAQNPNHTYTAPGSYNVSLTVTAAVGQDTQTKTSYITASSPVFPTAQFSGTPTSGQAPLAVQFTDESTPGSAPITSWSWSFGDGGTSTAQSPSHTYASAGSYTVSLAVQTSLGSDAETKLAYVSVFVLPTASFSGSPQSGVSPLAVQFTDQSTAGSSPITSRSWTFGDGGTSTAQNPSHTYTGAGTYTVSLTVATAVGQDTQTNTNYIAVSSPVAPTAQFSGTPTSGQAPLVVQFTDQSTAGSSPITSRSWTFGDGGTSTAQNPSHTYNAAGSYTVRLIVASSAGVDTLSRADYVSVFVLPTASFSGSPQSGATPLAVQFTDQSTAGSSPITSRSWTFGDGGTSTAQNPSHTYNAAGSYTVRLIVASSAGIDTLSQAGYIAACAPPVADFSGSPTGGLGPLIVQFTDQSAAGSSPITSWSWSFGDGGTSTEQSPSHLYLLPGSYDVSLTVGTACSESTAAKPGYITVSGLSNRMEAYPGY